MSEVLVQAKDAPASQAGGARYDSFAALRRAHIELRRRWSDGAVPAQEVRTFIARAVDTGAILEDSGDRRGAQGILDYWSAELVTSIAEKPRPSDYVPAVLAPFDASQAPATSKPSGSPEASVESNKRSQEVIRFVAAARLWQDSGKKPGYLLYGDAIAQAARYREVDPDIAELVAASEVKRSDTRMMVKFGVAAAIAAAIWAVFAWLQFEENVVPDWADEAIASIRAQNKSSSEKSGELRRLQWLQRWHPPFDLSGSSTVLANVSAPGIKLYAPNFSAAILREVDFREAQFPNATFSYSEIKGKFQKADLSSAQFRAATIQSTSFAEATLYRAVFDRACLRDVDFGNADLRLASFWGTSFEDNQRKFRNTAWWLAEGWNSDDLRQLTQQDQSNLSESPVFKKAVTEKSDELRKVEVGTIERAKKLNILAWEFASWGLVNDVIPESTDTPEQTCTSASGVPRTALDAADQAVCLAKSLNNTEVAENNSDTFAYILMQLPGRMADALNIYRKLPQSGDDRGGRIFRGAVAHYAAGDKARARSELKMAMQEHYVPSHELQTLKAHITGDFQEALYSYLDSVWPKPAGLKPCQFGSDAVNP